MVPVCGYPANQTTAQYGNTNAFRLFVVPFRTNGDVAITYDINSGTFTISVYVLNDTSCAGKTFQQLYAAGTICHYSSSPVATVTSTQTTNYVFEVTSGSLSGAIYNGLNGIPIEVPPWGGYSSKLLDS